MEKSCGVIPLIKVVDDMKVLLIRHNDGHRGFPKGHTEQGETEIETAKRELYEETGLENIQIDSDHVFTEDYSFIDKNKKDITKKVIYFVGYVRGSYTIKIQESELIDFKVCSFEDAILLLTFDSSKKILFQIKDKIEETQNKE